MARIYLNVWRVCDYESQISGITDKRGGIITKKSVGPLSDQGAIHGEVEKGIWLTPESELDRCFRDLAEISSDGIILSDATGKIVYFNRAAELLFGYRRRNVLGQPVEKLIPLSMAHCPKDGGEAPAAWEAQGVRRDRSCFPMAYSVSTCNGRAGRFTTYTVRDSIHRKYAKESMQLVSLVYRNSHDGMMIWDGSGIILDVNPAFTMLKGLAPEEAIGSHVRILRSGRHNREFYRSMWHIVDTTGTWLGEHWGQHKSGNAYPEWLSINTIFNSDGSVFRRVTTFSDITKIKQAETVIQKRAQFDFLTGLPNRHMFGERLDLCLCKAERDGGRLALLFLDLDRFKEVNDTLGHTMGDALLKQAAARLSSCVRSTDTVARLGGDEFAVIVASPADHAGVDRIARTILSKMAEPFCLGVDKVFISTSIGITFYPDDNTSLDALLNNADQAMYMAKSQGRNRHSYFTQSIQEAARMRMWLVSELHGALDGQQFFLVYQPIVTLATGLIDKAEALIRWRHPRRGLISPPEFIPIAEETGMITAIGDWVFREAARHAASWRTSYHPTFQVAVNASPVQFRSEGIDLESWLMFLRTIGLPTEGVMMEITEGVLLDTTAATSDQLLAFREAGIQIALDDFGTEYSFLSYLKRFDIDYVKIDQSFVNNLQDNTRDMALCEAIIVMAHKLGLKVIAEGIQTQEQSNMLRLAGCDYGQGNFFAGALSDIELQRLLAAQVATP